MSTDDINEMSVDELVAMLKDLTNEQLKLKIKKSVGQLSAPHRLRNVRRNIARVKTLLRLQEISKTLEEGEAA